MIIKVHGVHVVDAACLVAPEMGMVDNLTVRIIGFVRALRLNNTSRLVNTRVLHTDM